MPKISASVQLGTIELPNGTPPVGGYTFQLLDGAGIAFTATVSPPTSGSVVSHTFENVPAAAYTLRVFADGGGGVPVGTPIEKAVEALPDVPRLVPLSFP